MRTYSNSIVIKFDTVASGNAGAGKLVSVFDVGTTDKADLFNSSLAPIDNPVQADDEGNYTFTIDDGTYDLYIDFGLPTVTAILNEQISNIVGNPPLSPDDNVIAFDVLIDAVTETNVLKIFNGAALNVKERTTGNGGGAMWDVVLASTVTPNTFNIVQCTGVPTLALVLRVNNARVSTAQLGSNKSANDVLILRFALNNTDWSHVDIINYSPTGGSAYLERSNLVVDGNNRNIDFTGVSNPMIITGEDSVGAVLSVSNLNIDFRNMLTIGDRTVGSAVVKYRKTSTCTHHHWRISGLETAFFGDGNFGIGYESLACTFYDMDFRTCTIGFNDAAGSFQASKFVGGRIEQNQKEGVVTDTTNLTFDGTVIEGNDVLLAGHSQVRTSGGGDLQFYDTYMELKAASPNQSFITVDATSTKRITIVGGRFYGQNIGPNTAELVGATDWVTGSLTVIGPNLNNMIRIASRAGASGNWHGSFDYWATTTLDDPSLTLNSAAFSLNERVNGFQAKNLKALERVSAENLQVQQVGSGGFSREFQRFIGRVSVGGAGDWFQVIDLDDVGAAASTAIRFDLYFFERSGAFQFYTTIILNGTTTLGTKEDVSGNWTNSLYRINAGFLEVDNLTAANRDWTCRVVATKGTLT